MVWIFPSHGMDFIFQCALITLLAVCASMLANCARALAQCARDIDEIEDHLARIANAMERSTTTTAAPSSPRTSG